MWLGFGRLKYLESLNLGCEKLLQFPDEIWDLVNLTELRLYDINFVSFNTPTRNPWKPIS